MALTIEQIENIVNQSWLDFEKSYELEKKFGIVARQLPKNQNDSVSKEVLNIIGNHIKQLGDDLTSHLDLAYQARQKDMTPRAKQRPEQVNENKVDQNLTSEASKRLPPWPGADKIDFASNPNIRQAVDRFTNNVNSGKQELTTAFNELKAELKNTMKNEYKNRLTARMTPRPSAPTPKPNLGG